MSARAALPWIEVAAESVAEPGLRPVQALVAAELKQVLRMANAKMVLLAQVLERALVPPLPSSRPVS